LNAGSLEKAEEKWYNHLRDASWREGFDSFGFSALPAGCYFSIDKKFGFLGDFTEFWTSTEFSYGGVSYLRIDDFRAYVSAIGRYNGRSVRCLQD